MNWYQRRKNLRSNEHVRRLQLRPLRNAVNLFLKRGGFPRARMATATVGYQYCSEPGYTTESQIWLMPPFLEIEWHNQTRHPDPEKDKFLEMTKAVQSNPNWTTEVDGDNKKIRVFPSAKKNPVESC